MPVDNGLAESAVLHRHRTGKAAKVVGENDARSIRHRRDMANAVAERQRVNPSEVSVLADVIRRQPLAGAGIKPQSIRRKRLVKRV